MSVLARLGGTLVQPRATLRRIAGGEGGIGEVLTLMVVLLFAEEAERVGRALAAAPYLGPLGVLSQLVGLLGLAVPDLLALFVAATLMALLARRRGRELDVAACALVPWFALRLAAQLVAAILRLSSTATDVARSGEGRLALAFIGLAWGGVLWALALVDLRRLALPDAPAPPAPPSLAPRATAAGALLVAGLVALGTLQTIWIDRHRVALRPAGTSGSAPDFRLALLDGGTFHLREDPPGVTLVDFWATWCGPCRDELPVVNRLHARYRGRARVVAVEVSGSEAIPTASQIARQLHLSLPVAVAGDRASTLYHVTNLPHLVLVDRHGEIRRVFLGVHAEPEIAAALDDALAEP